MKSPEPRANTTHNSLSTEMTSASTNLVSIKITQRQLNTFIYPVILQTHTPSSPTKSFPSKKHPSPIQRILAPTPNPFSENSPSQSNSSSPLISRNANQVKLEPTINHLPDMSADGAQRKQKKKTEKQTPPGNRLRGICETSGALSRLFVKRVIETKRNSIARTHV